MVLSKESPNRDVHGSSCSMSELGLSILVKQIEVLRPKNAPSPRSHGSCCSVVGSGFLCIIILFGQVERKRERERERERKDSRELDF